MKHVVIGNGESRKWYCPSHQMFGVPVATWGCNAIYRNGKVDNLVAVDYGMQQEIYDSGYKGRCHFANWSVIPSAVADTMFMGYDIPEAFIHKSKYRTDYRRHIGPKIRLTGTKVVEGPTNKVGSHRQTQYA